METFKSPFAFPFPQNPLNYNEASDISSGHLLCWPQIVHRHFVLSGKYLNCILVSGKYVCFTNKKKLTSSALTWLLMECPSATVHPSFTASLSVALQPPIVIITFSRCHAHPPPLVAATGHCGVSREEHRQFVALARGKLKPQYRWIGYVLMMITVMMRWIDQRHSHIHIVHNKSCFGKYVAAQVGVVVYVEAG